MPKKEESKAVAKSADKAPGAVFVNYIFKTKWLVKIFAANDPKQCNGKGCAPSPINIGNAKKVRKIIKS